MSLAAPDQLVRRLLGNDVTAIAAARTSQDPAVLVALALVAPGADGLVTRAGELAATTRDRQLVAIAAAHLGGDRELVDALARDHLVDHPDSVLVAWIAGASRRGAALSHHDTKERS